MWQSDADRAAILYCWHGTCGMKKHDDDICDLRYLFIAGRDGGCRDVDAWGRGKWSACSTRCARYITHHSIFPETGLDASYVRTIGGGQHRGGLDRFNVPQLDAHLVGIDRIGCLAGVKRADEHC